MKRYIRLRSAYNMSKELEALERLKTHIVLLETKVGVDQTTNNPYAEDYHIVKSALTQAEKTEKAIELAKQIGWGNVGYVLQFETYEQFMGYIHNNKVYDIVKQAEFDLLKEVFER